MLGEIKQDPSGRGRCYDVHSGAYFPLGSFLGRQFGLEVKNKDFDSIVINCSSQPQFLHL
jgi:hypothetical protein